jgi:hypothetical protein
MRVQHAAGAQQDAELDREAPVDGATEEIAGNTAAPDRERDSPDRKVKDAAPMVGEDDQDEERAQASGRYRERIDRDEIADVVGQEWSPPL